MEYKRCARCCQELNLDCFQKSKQSKDGLYPYCKECRRKFYRDRYLKKRDSVLACSAKWAKNNKEKKKEGNKNYQLRNKEKIAHQKKIYHQKTLDRRREYIRDYMRNRRRTDLGFKLKHSLSSRLYSAVQKKSDSTIILLGCSSQQLITHLEEQFVEGMSWDNYGVHGWHIDHIKPCASFDLTVESEQRKCFHYTNLQPMWAADNISKSDNYCSDDFSINPTSLSEIV